MPGSQDQRQRRRRFTNCTDALVLVVAVIFFPFMISSALLKLAFPEMEHQRRIQYALGLTLLVLEAWFAPLRRWIVRYLCPRRGEIPDPENPLYAWAETWDAIVSFEDEEPAQQLLQPTFPAPISGVPARAVVSPDDSQQQHENPEQNDNPTEQTSHSQKKR